MAARHQLHIVAVAALIAACGDDGSTESDQDSPASCGPAMCETGMRCCDHCAGTCVPEESGAMCPDDNDPGRDCSPNGPSPSPGGSAEPSDSLEPEPSDAPSVDPSPVGSDLPDATAPPWDGKERLNILLIGADEQGGGHNTDTLITLSIDPTTGQVAMFSLPRDTVDVPVPPGPAQRV